MKRAALVPVFLFVQAMFALAAPQFQPGSYELKGGWWFDGDRFVRRTFYVVDGIFRDRSPGSAATVLDLGDAFIVPPFGDAHSHAFDNPATIRATVATNLSEGIFYGLSLANSIAGKRGVAANVNRPSSMDIAYADAPLTSPRGHPILSAEMIANGWPWDSVQNHWADLLKSRRAEGDAYFVVDTLADFERQWNGIVASRPDVIKIMLLNTDRYAVQRADSTALDINGLDPALVAPIVNRAHGEGLRVAAHVESVGDFRLAVTSGVDIIAHLPGIAVRSDAGIPRYTLTAADAALAAERHVVVVPTAWLATQELVSRGDREQIERTQQLQRQNLALLSRAGVSLAIGPDLYVTASAEAAYLLGLGVFDNRSVLRMWSRTTPRAIFPNRQIGELIDGAEASFLALSCDPIADFTCTTKISRRMKQGYLLPDP